MTPFQHNECTLRARTEIVDGCQGALVLWDMAPNMSGIGMVDGARVKLPAEVPQEFCTLHLKLAGDMLVKAFQGDGFMELRRALQQQF